MGKLKFSDKMNSIKPYEVDRRKYSVRLDANESFIQLPESVQEELAKKIGGLSLNRYPDSLSEELCSLYADYCGVPAKNIMAGNGSDELIQILVNAFVSKGEKILGVKPDFSMYRFYSSIMEGQFSEFPLDENLKLNVGQFIETAREQQSRIIILSNPCNPTGGVIPREDLIRIIEGCEALVIIDEAYFEFYGESLIDCIDKYDNLAILRTCSKAAGFAGVRLGFLIANEEFIYNVRKIKPPFNINLLTQAAGAVVLKNKELLRENVAKIIEERSFLAEELDKIRDEAGEEKFKTFPTKANFVYIKSSIADEIYNRLLDETISIRYFSNGALRITVGTRRENEIVVAALRRILDI